MAINSIGQAVKKIRTTMGRSRIRTAASIGVGTNRLAQIENGDTLPTVRILLAFRKAFGIDPYVLDYVTNADHSKLPQELQRLIRETAAEYEKQLAAMEHIAHLRPSW